MGPYAIGYYKNFFNKHIKKYEKYHKNEKDPSTPFPFDSSLLKFCELSFLRDSICDKVLGPTKPICPKLKNL